MQTAAPRPALNLLFYPSMSQRLGQLRLFRRSIHVSRQRSRVGLPAWIVSQGTPKPIPPPEEGRGCGNQWHTRESTADLQGVAHLAQTTPIPLFEDAIAGRLGFRIIFLV
jgi:hypothetical protein